MKNLVQVEDLVAICWASDDLILFVRREDCNNPLCLALKVNFDARVYYINLIQRFLKFGVYEEIALDKSVQDYYQQKIGNAFSKEMQGEMLAQFNKELGKWGQLGNKFKYGDNFVR